LVQHITLDKFQAPVKVPLFQAKYVFVISS